MTNSETSTSSDLTIEELMALKKKQKQDLRKTETFKAKQSEIKLESEKLLRKRVHYLRQIKKMSFQLDELRGFKEKCDATYKIFRTELQQRKKVKEAIRQTRNKALADPDLREEAGKDLNTFVKSVESTPNVKKLRVAEGSVRAKVSEGRGLIRTVSKKLEEDYGIKFEKVSQSGLPDSRALLKVLDEKLKTVQGSLEKEETDLRKVNKECLAYRKQIEVFEKDGALLGRYRDHSTIDAIDLNFGGPAFVAKTLKEVYAQRAQKELEAKKENMGLEEVRHDLERLTSFAQSNWDPDLRNSFKQPIRSLRQKLEERMNTKNNLGEKLRTLFDIKESRFSTADSIIIKLIERVFGDEPKFQRYDGIEGVFDNGLENLQREVVAPLKRAITNGERIYGDLLTKVPNRKRFNYQLSELRGLFDRFENYIIAVSSEGPDKPLSMPEIWNTVCSKLGEPELKDENLQFSKKTIELLKTYTVKQLQEKLKAADSMFESMSKNIPQDIARKVDLDAANLELDGFVKQQKKGQLEGSSRIAAINKQNEKTTAEVNKAKETLKYDDDFKAPSQWPKSGNRNVVIKRGADDFDISVPDLNKAVTDQESVVDEFERQLKVATAEFDAQLLVKAARKLNKNPEPSKSMVELTEKKHKAIEALKLLQNELNAIVNKVKYLVSVKGLDPASAIKLDEEVSLNDHLGLLKKYFMNVEEKKIAPEDQMILTRHEELKRARDDAEKRYTQNKVKLYDLEQMKDFGSIRL